MKFYLTLGLSALIHILILVALSYSGDTALKIKPQPPKPIVQAQLIFAPESEPEPQPVQEPAPIPKPIAKSTTKPVIKPIAEPVAKPASQPVTKPAVVSAKPFDPQSSIASLVAENDQAFFDSITSTTQPQQSYKSTNSVDPSAVDQSGLKAIFETAVRIDSDTRVVNYGGRCVQIKRELDHNGFSQFRWTGTSQKCGLDDEMNKQLKLSLSKYLRPKN